MDASGMASPMLSSVSEVNEAQFYSGKGVRSIKGSF